MDFDVQQPTDAQRYGICSAGFWIAGIALGLLGLSGALLLWVVFTADQALLLAMQQPGWTWAVDLPITAGALLGSLLLVGRWPDRNWQWRAGVLAAMNGFDAITWALTHHDLLGFEADLGRYGWLVENLVMLFGWAEFLLFATWRPRSPSTSARLRPSASIAGRSASRSPAWRSRPDLRHPDPMGRRLAPRPRPGPQSRRRPDAARRRPAADHHLVSGRHALHHRRHLLPSHRPDSSPRTVSKDDPFEAVSRYGTPRAEDESDGHPRR